MLKKIAFNTIISFIARVIGVILSFFSLALATRLLGREGFGFYSTALTIAYVMSFIADLGLYNLMVRELGRAGDGEEKRVASHIFTLRLASLFFTFIIGTSILIVSGLTFGVSYKAVFLAAFFYVLMSLNQLFIAVFQKYLRMINVALTENIGRIVILTGLLYLFFFNESRGNYESIIFVYGLGTFVFFLFNVFYAGKLTRFTLAFDYEYWKYLLKEALPIAFSVIFTALYFKMDTLYIAYFRGQEEVGLYNAAYKLLETLIFFPSMFVGILMPELSRLAVIDRGAFKKMFQGAFDVILLFTFPLVITILWEAEPIIKLIAGENFTAAGNVLGILSLGMGMIFFGALFSQVMLALNAQKWLALIYGIGAFFNIIANLLIIPRWGYTGAGVTTLFTEVLVTILMAVSVTHALYERLSLARLRPVLLASTTQGVFLWFTNIPLAASAGGGIILYAAVLFFSGGFTKKDIQLVMGT